VWQISIATERGISPAPFFSATGPSTKGASCDMVLSTSLSAISALTYIQRTLAIAQSQTASEVVGLVCKRQHGGMARSYSQTVSFAFGGGCAPSLTERSGLGGPFR